MPCFRVLTRVGPHKSRTRRWQTLSGSSTIASRTPPRPGLNSRPSRERQTLVRLTSFFMVVSYFSTNGFCWLALSTCSLVFSRVDVDDFYRLILLLPLKPRANNQNQVPLSCLLAADSPCCPLHTIGTLTSRAIRDGGNGDFDQNIFAFRKPFEFA